MPTSRVSTNQVFQNAQGSIASARERELTSSEKAASFKEIVRPSQDPTGWTIAADLKNDQSIRDTVAKNAGFARNILNATDSLLTRVQESVQRTQELALAGAGNEPSSVGSREHLLAEVEAIRKSVLQTVNTKYVDRTLLSGLKTQNVAFDTKGQFQGDSREFKVEVEKGLSIPINITGDRAILGEGRVNGVNLFQTLDTLILGLKSNNSELIQSTLPNFLKLTDQLSAARGEVAAAQSQIEQALDYHLVTKEQAADAISRIEDADMVKVFTELARDQTVLRAAVSTTQKVLTNVPSDIMFK